MFVVRPNRGGGAVESRRGGSVRHGRLQQWVYELNDKLHVVVEFLADTGDADTGDADTGLETLKGEAISAARPPFVGIARDWYGEHRVTVDIGGAKTTEVVRYGDATAFIVRKAIAFEHWNERKDAADLFHVLR